jgi:hypothetical protein
MIRWFNEEILVNPWDAVGKFFAELIEGRRLERWLKLGVTMFFSAVVYFLSAMGTALLARQPWPVAVGSGMLAAAVALVFLWNRSPLTKGLMVAEPKDVIVEAEGMNSGLATVERK